MDTGKEFKLWFCLSLGALKQWYLWNTGCGEQRDGAICQILIDFMITSVFMIVHCHLNHSLILPKRTCACTHTHRPFYNNSDLLNKIVLKNIYLRQIKWVVLVQEVVYKMNHPGTLGDDWFSWFHFLFSHPCLQGRGRTSDDDHRGNVHTSSFRAPTVKAIAKRRRSSYLWVLGRMTHAGLCIGHSGASVLEFNTVYTGSSFQPP